MPRWGKMAAKARKTLRAKPVGWYKKLGRPLSAAEVEAYLGTVKPCPGALMAAGNGTLNQGHPLWGWWEIGRGEYSRQPHLDAVFRLAVNRELRRRSAARVAEKYGADKKAGET